MPKTNPNAKSAKVAETAELLPAVQISNGVGNLEENGTRVVRYHEAAMRCANLSVWCSAMAGAEMLAAKQRLQHGEFGQWLASLTLPNGKGISNGTAHNYMNLAERLQEKLSTLPKNTMAELMPALKGEQQGAQTALAILNLPDPLDVFNPAHDRIAKIIHHVTSGASLRQLYFDWGIVPQPKKVELPKGPPLQLEPGETMAHRTAVETFDKAFADLWSNVRDYKLHLHLDLDDLKRYSNDLLDLRRTFDALLKRG